MEWSQADGDYVCKGLQFGKVTGDPCLSLSTKSKILICLHGFISFSIVNNILFISFNLIK